MQTVWGIELLDRLVRESEYVIAMFILTNSNFDYDCHMVGNCDSHVFLRLIIVVLIILRC